MLDGRTSGRTILEEKSDMWNMFRMQSTCLISEKRTKANMMNKNQ